MRCRDGEGGPVVREQELQQGRFMGVVRYFKDGALEREHRVNERGNRDGLAREWARAEAGGKSVLVREETYRDGRNTGTTRSWYPSGQLRRVSFHGDDDREQAVAEFTPQGQLADLRCARGRCSAATSRRQDGCGRRRRIEASRSSAPRVAPRARRVVRARASGARANALGERARSTSSRRRRPRAASSVRSRPTARSGAKCSGRPSPANGHAASPHLDQEFHESGKLVRERRWRPGERGGELVSEASWYLNGQPPGAQRVRHRRG